MNQVKENTPLTINSIEVIKGTETCLNKNWHYSPHFQLNLINYSSGIRFVGDNISKFFSEDLVLIGPYLPHSIYIDPNYSACGNKDIKIISIKFETNFPGDELKSTPKLKLINQLLTDSKRGLGFDRGVIQEIRAEIEYLIELSGIDRINAFINILHRLSSKSKQKSFLSSYKRSGIYAFKKERFDSILKHIYIYYPQQITLDYMADLAEMAPNSFCRYFKQITTMPFSQFLTEVRIQNAKIQLLYNELSIKDISKAVGYRSLTNFNRQFKKSVGTTPIQYKFSAKYSEIECL